ncbi:MAG: protein kinase [Bacteroidaceae bacterium]|nr:protein kinase [Bacteroidaceae bacterium]
MMKTNESLPIGTILDSGVRKYEIVSTLGQGGFGITYLAKATVNVDNIPIEAMFAIKEHFISSMNERRGTTVITTNSNNKDEIAESLKSFITEAKRLNKLSLNHPGIVRVNEHFQTNDTAYYVMEYVKGQSLREFVRKAPQGKLSEEDALQLFRPIAKSIAYLHEHKVTHLDIKPDNILIRENGQPVVIDFGLSKHYSSQGAPTSSIKAVGCSNGYSPMEQYAGIKTFTPEADIYALAATLYFMLTGKDPVISTEINKSIIQNGLPDNLSEQTANAILNAMAKLKEDRTAKVEDMLKALKIGSSSDETNGEEKTPLTKTIKERKESHIQKYLLWGIGGAALVVLLVLFCLPHGENTPDEEIGWLIDDSMSYTLGMTYSKGIKDYLSSTMNVDTTLHEEIKEGFRYGSGVDEDLAQPLYEGEQLEAYNAGVAIGTQLKETIIPSLNSDIYGSDSLQSISLYMFMEGFTDAFDNNNTGLFYFVNMEQAEAVAERTMAAVKARRYEANKEEGEAFLEENKNKEGIRVLPSGVQYKVIKEGTGEIPSAESIVTVHYEGRLMDGTVFDSSYEQETPAEFSCRQVIKGFADALTHMPVGSTWEVYIPQELAYGEQQASDIIKPYSMLIFKIELISTKEAPPAH